MAIDAETCATYLERLDFGVEPGEGGALTVTVPPDRAYDVTREVDLIEEVARVHGIDEHLPTTLPAAREMVGGLTREQPLRRRAEDVMRDLGFDEIVGWSFTDPDARLQSDWRPAVTSGRGQQPALGRAVGDADDPARLAARRRGLQLTPDGAERVALFEAGARLSAPGDKGDRGPERRCRKKPRPAVRAPSAPPGGTNGLLLDLKAVLEALAGHLGVRPRWRRSPSRLSAAGPRGRHVLGDVGTRAGSASCTRSSLGSGVLSGRSPSNSRPPVLIRRRRPATSSTRT